MESEPLVRLAIPHLPLVNERDPLGGVERQRWPVRFARLIHRRVRALGRPLASAAFGGNLSLPWTLLTVVPKEPMATSSFKSVPSATMCSQQF